MKKEIIEKLLRARYDPNYTPIEKMKVVVESRGSPNNEKIISGKKIIKVDRRGIYLEDDIFIPAHRLKRIIVQASCQI